MRFPVGGPGREETKQAAEVPAVEEEYGDQGPYMQRNLDQWTHIQERIEVKHVLEDYEVAGARDGQELGQALNHP
jgi:hypothetical protein